MRGKTRTLLEELDALSEKRDASHIIENRAANIISSAINLMEMIAKNYSPERAEILERKLLVAIKSRDQSRFTKSLRKKNEDK
jgi:hypothetical protein